MLDKQQNVPGPVDFGGRKMLANVPVFVGVEVDEPSDKDFSVLAGINALVFPFAQLGRAGRAARRAASAGAGASCGRWRRPRPRPGSRRGFFFFSPATKIEEGKEKGGSFALGYAYQGR